MPTHTQLSSQKQTRIRQLAQDGHSKHMIAKLTGVSYPTVDKYVALNDAREGTTKALKASTSPLLHELLGLSMHFQHKLLTSLGGEDISSWSVTDKRQMLRDNSIVFGTIYDKIRLQDGKSTANNSHEIQMQVVHKDMPVPLVSSGPVRSAPENITTQSDKTQ